MKTIYYFVLYLTFELEFECYSPLMKANSTNMHYIMNRCFIIETPFPHPCSFCTFGKIKSPFSYPLSTSKHYMRLAIYAHAVLLVWYLISFSLKFF